jgi:hypothetical protein
MSFNNSSAETPSNVGFFFQIDPETLRVNMYVSLIGYIYMAPIVCVCGFVLNIVCMVVLCTGKELKGNIYKYFIVKTASELVVVTCGALWPISFCTSCVTSQTFVSNFYRAYIFTFLVGSCFNLSSMCEIALTYDRMLIFKQRRRFLPKLSFWPTATFSFAFSALLFAPYIFYMRVLEIPNSPGKYMVDWSEIGRTTFYTYYGHFAALISVILFIILLLLNIIVLIEYRKYALKRASLVLANKSNARLKSSSKEPSRTQISNVTLTASANANRLSNSSAATRESRMLMKEDSEKRLAYSIMCCCAIYGFYRLLLATAAIISEIELISQGSAKFFLFSSFTTIFTFASRFIAYFIFSANLFILALFNNAFKEHLLKVTKRFLFIFKRH